MVVSLDFDWPLCRLIALGWASLFRDLGRSCRWSTFLDVPHVGHGEFDRYSCWSSLHGQQDLPAKPTYWSSRHILHLRQTQWRMPMTYYLMRRNTGFSNEEGYPTISHSLLQRPQPSNRFLPTFPRRCIGFSHGQYAKDKWGGGCSLVVIDWGSVILCVTVQGDVGAVDELPHGTTVRSSTRADAVCEIDFGHCIVSFREVAWDRNFPGWGTYGFWKSHCSCNGG